MSINFSDLIEPYIRVRCRWQVNKPSHNIIGDIVLFLFLKISILIIFSYPLYLLMRNLI